MKRTLLFALMSLVTTLPARAFDAEHLARLLNTGSCFACDLKGADLSGQDLRNADLVSAVLIGADLSNARLSNADMRNTQLNGASLRGADMRGVVMVKSVITGADLTGADFTGAMLQDIDFSTTNADLGALARARLCAVKVDHDLTLFEGC